MSTDREDPEMTEIERRFLDVVGCYDVAIWNGIAVMKYSTLVQMVTDIVRISADGQ